MNPSLSLKALAVACGVLAFSSPAMANLFVNGGFEDITGPGVTPSTSVNVGQGGQPALPGWNVTAAVGGTSPQAILYGTSVGSTTLPTPVSEGTYALQLSSNAGGANGAYTMGTSITQRVTIDVGAPYTFSFAYRGEFSPVGSASLGILVKNVAGNFPVFAQLLTLDNSAWQTFTTTLFGLTPGQQYDFTFVDGPTSLNGGKFDFTGSNPDNMALDNINLFSPVPELSTWIGFALLGFFGIGWQHRNFLRSLLNR